MSVVLVTGCTTGGIGHALVNEFAAKGCTVYATSRRLGSMSFESKSIRTMALDVTNHEMVDSVITQIHKEAGRIDIVVNNAGATAPGPLIDCSMESVRENFETNTFSVLKICKTVIPFMAQRKSGLIINIGSIAAEVATPWGGVYSASKAAMHSMTDTLYMETKPLGIKVVLVAPGAIKSRIADNGARRFELPEDSLYKEYLSNIVQRIFHSQQQPMSSEAFSTRIVRMALSQNPAYFLSLGPMSTVFWLWKRFFPRVTSLNILWSRFSKKKQ